MAGKREMDSTKHYFLAKPNRDRMAKIIDYLVDNDTSKFNICFMRRVRVMEWQVCVISGIEYMKMFIRGFVMG